MSAVPTGWVETTLTDLCQTIASGRRPKGGVRGINEGVLSLGGEHVGSNGKVDLSTPRFIPHEFAANIQGARIETNDILVVKDGATTGKVAIADVRFEETEAYVNEHVFLCRAALGVDPKLLFSFLRSGSGREAILSDFRGAAQGGISRQFSDKVKVALPPTAEQRRIIEKTDSLTTKSERARYQLDPIPRLVQKYKQAILAAAFRGNLTSDWRDSHEEASGERLREKLLRVRADAERGKKLPVFDFSGVEQLPQLPASWTWMPVAALATKVVDGVHKKPEYIPSGVPFLTVKNLTAGPGISFEGCRYISESDHQDFIKRTQPECGDILITKDGTLGVIRAIKTEIEFSIFVSLALVKPVDKSMTDYLEFAFQSPIVQDQMAGVGSGLQHIHLTDLRKDFIPIAPENERDEVLKRLDCAMQWIDRLAADATSARKLIDHLDHSILAKAFRGELVPQDPADEPASALLDRIRAERATAPKGRRKTA